ncbi:hypothetical protein CCR75_003183 [Bremia lactucae]|uniref:SSD domain-containing protein n=1 Tax=Bremia lactucae TaxID=4779 RepID=A0A976FMA9_BRELC|nr:hypothetical protein CCR75_003183 [Bremia lactucae]
MITFYHLGALSSRYPVLTVVSAAICSAFLCLGLLTMKIQTDPQGLWVPPNSVAATEQKRFNELFGPFYRIEQLLFFVESDPNPNLDHNLVPSATCDANHDLIQRRFLIQMAKVQTQITNTLIYSHDEANVSLSLETFCYKPIEGKGCLITSPFQYWLTNFTILENDPDIKLTTACQTTDPVLQKYSPCMDQNGVPVMRNVVFGGLQRDLCHTNPDPCGDTTSQAIALIVTFLLNHHPENQTYTKYVKQWEKEIFVTLAEQAAESLKPSKRNWSNDFVWDGVDDLKLASVGMDGMRLTYMAERSIADSLDVQTQQNAFIVILSYLVMFLYVSLSLGKSFGPVESRFGLGMTGILIVLLSVGAAMGLSCLIFQMKMTMIAFEVVPFLILAIGVDNIFIITNEFDRVGAERGLLIRNNTPQRREYLEDEKVVVHQVMNETMRNVGPSILVAAIAETLAFLVGAFTRIPALRNFCIVAALAVTINWILQFTWFTAALTLDTRRIRARRYDWCPWIIEKGTRKPFESTKSAECIDSTTNFEASSLIHSPASGRIQHFIEKNYIPFLLQRSTKVFVIVSALVMLILSAMGSSKLPLGLKQELAVPVDFYLHEYFQKQTALGEAGPPAYLVFDGHLDYTDATVQQGINLLLDELAGLEPYIEMPIYSWLHLLNQWRQMRFFLHEKIHQGRCDCPFQPMAPFAYESIHRSATTNVTPNALFYPLVRTFIDIKIDSTCCQEFGFCGAQYANDIIFSDSRASQDTNMTENVSIIGSRMRFQLKALRNQSMYINSYYYLHKVTRQWSARHNIVAFPYALVFVYEEQYTYIQGVALQCILLALAIVFGAVFVLFNGCIRLSAVVTLCVFSMTFSQLGLLYAWNSIADSEAKTSINAIFVVNLLASIGLGVEFCIHLAHQFAFSRKHYFRKSGNDHTRYALTSVGASIFSGITLTKCCGIGVLAFAPSMLFRVYFFRMYLGIVLLGCFHGLVLLPVLLSLLGQPQQYFDDLNALLLSETRNEGKLDKVNLLDEQRS